MDTDTKLSAARRELRAVAMHLINSEYLVLAKGTEIDVGAAADMFVTAVDKYIEAKLSQVAIVAPLS